MTQCAICRLFFIETKVLFFFPIGLSIRVKLLRSLPPRFKVDVTIAPGTHASETAVNKQLADKERVAAALENAHLLG